MTAAYDAILIGAGQAGPQRRRECVSQPPDVDKALAAVSLDTKSWHPPTTPATEGQT